MLIIFYNITVFTVFLQNKFHFGEHKNVIIKNLTNVYVI